MSSILLCDDEVTLSRILARALSQAGHTVRQAASGRAAIEEATAQRFDLVLTDLRLPDMQGLTVLQAVRALPEPPIVLVMTGHLCPETAVEAMRLGAQDCLCKPFSLADLCCKVAEVLSCRAPARQGEAPLRDRLALQSPG